ncbi:MAG: hypothetical protein WDM87_12850 [Terracidiphilus sp.]
MATTVGMATVTSGFMVSGVRPPHHGAVWVSHHWERRGDGWVLVEGHWR